MSWITAHHNQAVTYWALSGNDSSGDPSYAAPVVLRARWEDRTVVFTNFRGEEATSMAIAWFDRDLILGSFLLLGSSSVADPLAVADALEIQGRSSVPALEGNVFERKVFMTARTVR